MNINEYISNFIEAKLKSSHVLAPYIAAGLGICQDTAGENRATPYIRYIIAKPTPIGNRDLQLRIGAFKCSVTVNVLANTKEQVRELSTEVRDIFDEALEFEGFGHIEDCMADEPEENFPFDAFTGEQIYETAQTVNFNFIK